MSYGRCAAWDDVQHECGSWAEKQFPASTPSSVLKHFEKEVKELLASGKPEEVADCVLLLIHYAFKKNFSLYQEIMKKFEVNQNRKWGKPDKDGVTEHVRE